MKKYEVFLTEIEKYRLEVEAESKSEAIDKAREILAEDNKDSYYYDSDGESDATEI